MIIKVACGILMALCFVIIPVHAQDQQSGDEHQPPSAEDIVAKLQSKLNLTQDQVTAVTPIIEKYSSKREDLRQSMEDGTADRDSIRSQMKQLKTDENQELSQILSSDQMSQFEQMQSQRMHQHDNGVNASDSGPGASGSGGDNPPPQ